MGEALSLTLVCSKTVSLNLSVYHGFGHSKIRVRRCERDDFERELETATLDLYDDDRGLHKAELEKLDVPNLLEKFRSHHSEESLRPLIELLAGTQEERSYFMSGFEVPRNTETTEFA